MPGSSANLSLGSSANLSLGGAAQVKAAWASNLPAPQLLLGTVPVNASVRALFTRQSRTCCCVRLRLRSSISAIAPVTCGAAILVPANWLYCPVPLLIPLARADIIHCPGAEMVGDIRPSRVGPRLENVESEPTPAPEVMYEPTVMTSCDVPGMESVIWASTWLMKVGTCRMLRSIQASKRPLETVSPVRVNDQLPD